MDERRKLENVWSLDTPEWIHFFNKDVFLDYKDFISRKLPVKSPSSLSTSRSSYPHPGPYYYSFHNQREEQKTSPSGSGQTKIMFGCQRVCRMLWLLSCLLVVLGLLGVIFVTIFIIITDHDRKMNKNIDRVVHSTAPPTVNVTTI